jgi:hypothetical protein
MVYIMVYTTGDDRMNTAKLFKGIVILIPKDKDPWQPFIDSLKKFTDDFFDFRRDQGTFEKREPIK